MSRRFLLGMLLSALLPITATAGDKLFDLTVSFTAGKASCQIEFDVVMKDSKTKELVFSPHVCTKQGEPAKATLTDPQGREFSFSVTFDKGGKSGKYEVLVTKDGKEIQKDEGVFTSK